MASFHRCNNCGCETDGTSALTAFEDNPHCRQCGLSLAESDSKMQDDLVNMMTQHLQLNPDQRRQDSSMPPTPQVVPVPAPLTYITQHYHHSAHQVPAESSVSAILEAAGVNASVLLPSQIMLFRNAEPDQQQRLIELWRIAPPTYGNQLLAKDLGNWPQTSMEQEEEAAQYRWECVEQERLKNLCALPAQDARTVAEPYIVSGYGKFPSLNQTTAPAEHGAVQEAAQRKPSNDPAYNSREWWHMAANAQPMEHQYGLLQQMMYGSPLEYAPTQKDDEEML